MRLSFIIPALNEQQTIPATLRSISQCCPAGFETEIIVADHGSSDQTAAVAASHGAIVISPRTSTIAGLRNAGARRATGDVFVFLDADVQLTDEWGANASAMFSELVRSPDTVAGSRVLPPNSTSRIIKYWFKPLALAANQTTYINSAHLIVPRPLFESLNGFNDELVTGEDYDFCRRAAAAGFSIRPDLSLVVYHDRYPKGVNEFLRREIWHGQGDAKSLRHILTSKVALASIVFAALHAIIALGAVLQQPAVIYGAAFSILLTVLFMTWKKFGVRQHLDELGVRLGLAYVYLLARALSLVCHPSGWSKPVMSAPRSA